MAEADEALKRLRLKLAECFGNLHASVIALGNQATDDGWLEWLKVIESLADEYEKLAAEIERLRSRGGGAR